MDLSRVEEGDQDIIHKDLTITITVQHVGGPLDPEAGEGPRDM